MTKPTGRPRGRPRKRSYPQPDPVIGSDQGQETMSTMSTTTATATDRTASHERAYARLNEALAAEENARAGGGGPVAVEAAKREVAEAREDLERIKAEREAAADEEMVVLVAPNPSIPYVKYTNNLEFRYGRALAPRSVANHYLDVLDGYSIEEGE